MILDKVRDQDDDKYCTLCPSLSSEAAKVLRGHAGCGYCGNQINLCQTHLDQLITEAFDAMPNEPDPRFKVTGHSNSTIDVEFS